MRSHSIFILYKVGLVKPTVFWIPTLSSRKLEWIRSSPPLTSTGALTFSADAPGKLGIKQLGMKLQKSPQEHFLGSSSKCPQGMQLFLEVPSRASDEATD